MNTTSPIALQKTDKIGPVAVYMITEKSELDTIDGIDGLKDKIAERVGDDELVFTVPTADGLTIIAKGKTENEKS
jgi:hypothetical protein